MIFEKTFREYAPFLAIAAGVFVCLILIGCGTVTPKIVESQTIAFDGDSQNAGIISKLPDGSYLITANARQKYDSLIAKWATDGLIRKAHIQPPLAKDAGLTANLDGTWLIDAQHAAIWAKMNLLDRSGIKP
jgi:hypothetical protein